MNSTPENSILNRNPLQAPSAANLEQAEEAAARHFKSPLAPTIGGMPEPSNAPPVNTAPLDASPAEPEPPNVTLVSERCPLSDNQPSQRPGVTNRTLRENRITSTEPGLGNTWGLKIPYFTFEGSATGRRPMSDGKGGEFFRKRLAKAEAGGRKYSQPAGTPPCAYFPLGLAPRLEEHRFVILTEGEFKAISLGEAGYPAVGLGGFYNFRDEYGLLPELAELVDWMLSEGGGCHAIYFRGDTDTVLNHQFADAVIKFRDCLRAANIQVPLLLPRMTVEEMANRKGIDDARGTMPTPDFGNYLQALLDNAIPVSTDLRAADLLMVLFDHDRNGISKILGAASTVDQPPYRHKLARLANAAGPIGAEEIEELCLETGLFTKKSHFKQERKAQAEEVARDMESKRVRRPVQLFYCPSGNKNYLYAGPSGVTKVDRSGALNYLVLNGYSRKSPIPNQLSEAETMLTVAEQRPLDWCGPLAGRQAGVINENGLRLLVTKSPSLVVPKEGEWPTVRQFLESRLDYDPAHDPNTDKQATRSKTQSPYFYGYLQHAARSLYLQDGAFMPSQAAVFVGPKSTGKNTIQGLITKLFGDRQADPFDFMEGTSGFNGELAGAEHWMIADKQKSTRHADREKLKSCIKEGCVNRTIRINGKFQMPLNVEIWRRLTISLNDNPECLRVLPSLSDDFADKVMILHVVGRPFHGAGTDFPTFADWEHQIEAELPAFLHYLLHEHETAAAIADLRYGVVSYRDPEIVAKMQQESPEERLAELIAHYVMNDRVTSFEASAREILDAIRISGGASELASMNCDSPQRIGTYLGHLVGDGSGRFSHRTLNGTNLYRIAPSLAAAACDETDVTESDEGQAAA